MRSSVVSAVSLQVELTAPNLSAREERAVINHHFKIRDVINGHMVSNRVKP